MAQQRSVWEDERPVQSITDQFTEHEHPLKKVLTLFGIERKEFL
jgi:hypothetical protein